MGTFISTLGKLSIPEDRLSAFLEDAKRVAYQGGLFSESSAQIFGKRLWLISFPSFDIENEEKYADFVYSCYENDSWENAGIDLEECKPYSGKVGWSRFNRAVQALYILAELYSETPFFSFNTSQTPPSATIKWLRYVLGRDVQYTWRKDLWNVYELIAQEEMKYYHDIRSGYNDILDDYLPDNFDALSLIDILAYDKGIGFMIDDFLDEKEENDGSEKKLTYIDFVRIYRNGIMEYQKCTDADEESQIEFLLDLLTCDKEKRDKTNYEGFWGVKMGLAFVTPKVIIKVISEIYQKDFWQLWERVRDNITVEPTPFSETIKQEETSEKITTEDFFRIDSWTRLYWWTENGDVKLNDDIINWLKAKGQQFNELCSEPIPGNVNEWQKRFVTLLADHPKAFCFEDVFYEFIGNFHDNKYKAAVLLLENTAEKKEEYRHLLAVYANNKLRGTYFGF